MIKIDRLVKTYGETESLKSISIEVPRGQICGYVGPNGAGKSTTIKILTGTLRPTAGRAIVAGFDVQTDPIEVKRRIGYVPETAALYETLSTNEYLTLVGTLHDMTPEDIATCSRKMLELFDITDAGNRRLGTLSKGMRQKVVIASALLHDPDVILMDEPLSGLDANAAYVVKNIIRSMADRGKTILFCSHMLDIVERLCERVVILNRGEIVADCATNDLIGVRRAQTLEEVFRDLTSIRDSDKMVAEFIQAMDAERENKQGTKRRRGPKTG
jgi:ABC-2 type transport system ATP-binding protein